MVRNRAQGVCVLSTLVVLNFSAIVSAADAPKNVDEQHEAAVEQARNGDIIGGLKQLDVVIDEYPDFYPAKRDYAIIATWNDDCDTAMTRFNVIRETSPLEGYLVEPIAECLRDLRQLDQAIALLKASLAKNPDDEDAKRALGDLQNYIRLQSRPTLDFRVGFNESDLGNKEWREELKYSHEISSNMRAYYRHVGLQADKKETGLAADVSRAGLGLLNWFGIKFLLDVEVVTDVKTSGQEGARINLNYYPNPLWEFGIGHNSSEEAPLRARKFDNVAKSVSSAVSSSYHSEDYRWEWSANAQYTHISDTNVRNALGTSLGYAYELEDQREQRVILEFSRSRNSKSTGIDYYSPQRDWSATVNLRVDNVYDSEWERLVSHLTLYMGRYNQFAQRGKNHGGVRYELELEFSNTQALSIELDYASRVYDGQSELQTGISIAYSHKL